MVFLSALVILCAGLILAGCKSQNPADIKTKVDDNVYRMIDRKWKDEFGIKANYRIDGAVPSPNDISTSRMLSAGTILTLPQAVEFATDHNRIYQLEKENLYIKALDLRLARHQFEPLLFGEASAGYVKDGADEAITTGAGIGANQLLKTGATIGVNLAAAWVEVLTGNARSGFARIFSVAIEQPLLKGSDPNVVLENLTQAERDLLYQIRSFNRFRKKFVVSTITQYYLVLQAYDAAQNARNNYDTLVETSGYAAKLAAAGRVPHFELDQAFQDTLIAWDTYVQAEKDYRRGLDDFKLAIALPTETELLLDYNELTVLRDCEMKVPRFSETEAIDTALARRLDLANTFDVVNDAERKILVALDNIRPDLRLVVAAELRSDGVSDPVTLGRTKDTAFAGVRFNPNLDKVAQENVYRLALIVLDQNRRFFEEKVDTVIVDVREVYRDLNEAIERYKVQSEQLSLARQRFENTKYLLQYGRANTRDVLDSQRDLYRAQDNATLALVNYTTAMLRFYRNVEILQVRPDGMWQANLTTDIK
jgi:outer membrane protein TolC